MRCALRESKADKLARGCDCSEWRRGLVLVCAGANDVACVARRNLHAKVAALDSPGLLHTGCVHSLASGTRRL
jgi:hypothetical protein